MDNNSKSSRESVYLSKESTRSSKIEYMNIKVSDSRSAERSDVHPPQTGRRPLQHQPWKGAQSEGKSFEVIMEESIDCHLRSPEELRLTVKQMTISHTKNKMSQDPHRGRSSTMDPTKIPALSTIKKTTDQYKDYANMSSARPRRLHRSNSITGTKKSLECVRIVLIGKTGVGKSATGNTILGHSAFESRARMTSTTKVCQRESGIACGRAVTVVDTPGLFDTSLSNEVIQQEIMRCIELSAPGPHVFLLLISIGPFTREERETLELIKMTFGQNAQSYTMVLFTKGDNLDDSIEAYIKDGDSRVKQLIHDCGGRFHVFNNKQKDPGQVVGLLKKIDKMMWDNKSSFYNDQMFQEVEKAFRLKQINREKEEEVRREMEALKAKHESEIKQYKEKLEEEKAKGKVREFLLLEKETKLYKKIQSGKITEDSGTTESEQTKDQYVSKGHEEGIKQEENEELKEVTTEGESHQIKNMHRPRLRKIGSFLDPKVKEKYQKRKEKCDKKETKSPEVKSVKKKHTDQKIDAKQKKSLQPEGQTDTENLDKELFLPKNTEDEIHLNKNKLLHEQYLAMEQCKQKMEEIKNRYKEIEEIHAEELRKMKKTHDETITAWKKDHGNCVLQ
nr:immune-associated nucleotide-binding protein 8-like [Danio rerio]|eukprot:XP_009304630.1 immune-associated nucleotide-binding protein 8-like [Danio rerio]